MKTTLAFLVLACLSGCGSMSPEARDAIVRASIAATDANQQRIDNWAKTHPAGGPVICDKNGTTTTCY